MLICTSLVVLALGQAKSNTPPAAEAGIHWRATPDEALAEAKRTGKFAALYFFADWCTFSKHLNDKVLTDPAVITLFDRFVPCKIECESQRPLMRRFRAAGFPVLLLVDGDGRRVDELDGSPPAADYARQLQIRIDSLYNRADWERKAAATPPDAEALGRLAVLAADREDFEKARALVERAAAADPKDAHGLCLKTCVALAKNAGDTHDTNQALAWFQKALGLARTPADQAAARLGVAEQLYRLGKPEAAADELRLVQKLPGAPAASTQSAGDLLNRIEHKKTKKRKSEVREKEAAVPSTQMGPPAPR